MEFWCYSHIYLGHKMKIVMSVNCIMTHGVISYVLCSVPLHTHSRNAYFTHSSVLTTVLVNAPSLFAMHLMETTHFKFSEKFFFL